MIDAFLKKFNVTELLGWIGLLVGLAFVIYFIRSVGYFSVIGPELLWMYVDINVIQGAVFALPGVILIVSLSFVSIGAVFYLINYEEKNGELSAKVPSFLKKLMRWTAWVFAFFGLFIFEWLFGPDKYGVRMLVFSGFVVFYFGVATDLFFNGRKVLSALSATMMMVMLYNTLLELGKFEAYRDLERIKPQYNVWVDDKVYRNVIILRTSSNSIIIKAEKNLIFYDKERIKRLVRLLD